MHEMIANTKSATMKSDESHSVSARASSYGVMAGAALLARLRQRAVGTEQ
jgi:hypothetical protein